MILYHGTNIDFEEIDIEKSNPYKDFEKGFYLTEIRTQAEELAKKKARIFGGKPIVQSYEFDESYLCNDYLNVLTFTKPAKELEYKKLNNQYFFGTKRAIKYLKRI